MAILTKTNHEDLLNNLLPTFGNPRVRIPVWDEEQKMFLCGEYESALGHRYYRGLRICDQIVIVEKVGLFHNWTYIDAIEIYAFNGNKLELVQKKDYEKVFRKEEFIRSESEAMLINYFKGCLKVQRHMIPQEELENKVKSIVDKSYKSFLDSDYNVCFTKILPQIEKN